jgi:hypothetical protein
MKTISQYREDIKSLKKKGDDIEAKATAENRDLTESELSLMNELGDATDDLMKTVATLERRDRTAKILETPEGTVTVPKNKKGDPPENKDRFTSLGQQLSAVVGAGRPSGHVDPRLFNAASGLNETVPSEGGLR